MGKKITQEEFEERIRNRLGPDYAVLGQYLGRDVKIEMKHLVCGNTFMKRPHDAMNKGSGCPFCNGAKPALYNEKWVKEHTLDPYQYIQGYSAMSKKCIFYCKKCNSFFEQSPKRLINEHIFGCNCCPTKKKTHQQFLDELGAECLKEYEVLDNYINIDTKIRFKHKKCGTVFELTPWSFIHKAKKHYCPICYYKKSKGEIEIATFLTKHNILFHKEFVFPDIGNKQYKFDFYLPDFNTVIEYDGEQHFFAIDFFGGEENLQKTQKRDKAKNQYCIQYNIRCYRIPYTDFSYISQILNGIFEEKSSTTIEKYLVTE